MIPWQIPTILAALAAQTAAPGPAGVQSPWIIREELQVPTLAANHVVGGAGVGVEAQRGVFALDAEAQLLFVAICDNACGSGYAAGLGISVTPGHWGDVASHLSLLAEYFVQPVLHQSLPALSPRAGFRWFSGGTGLSLDAGLTLATANNFQGSGFARNKLLGWAMPEVLMGLWF